MLGLCPIGVDAERERLPLAPERVTETLRRYVLEQSAWQPEQVEVVLRSFTPPAIPNDAVDLVILKPNRGITPGVRRFLLSVRVNGREEGRFWVDAEVRVFANVIVTSQPLAHYELLSAEKVRVERRDLGSLPLQPLTSFEDLNGKQAARPIEVNQVLTAAMVELPRVIRRGGAVTLVYESAGLRVETTGRAAEPGRVGDRIHVENPSSGKIVEGHILDERTVKVN
jgi:flagella basal body P-ring formation protein FlgA